MNNHLKHYGILGMRWGRRKSQQSSSGGNSGSASRKSRPSRSRNKSIRLGTAVVGAIVLSTAFKYVTMNAVMKSLRRDANEKMITKYKFLGEKTLSKLVYKDL